MTPTEFSATIAAPNVQEAMSKPDDARLVFNACAAIEGLTSHFFVHLQSKSLTSFEADSVFKKDLAQRSEAFSIVHDVAECQKHAVLTRGNRDVKSSTDVKSAQHGYDHSLWGELMFDVSSAISVEINGQTRTVAPLAQKALSFLNDEIQKVS
jgi:hypothetical protein